MLWSHNQGKNIGHHVIIHYQQIVLWNLYRLLADKYLSIYLAVIKGK